MSIQIIAGIFILFIVLCLLILKNVNFKQRDTSEDYKHFIKRNYLMTVPERKFYDILTSVVGAKYHIAPQTVLSNVVSVNRYEKNKGKYRNKINRYALDFVLYEKPNFTPYLVIELDDTSHLLPERESRDGKVNAILEGVGVRVVHVKTEMNYNIEQIAKIINTYN
ncbi:MAG: DUF2726 domain-containing protein [Patescibacteria group bacterium]